MPLTLADVVPGAEALAEYNGTWWPARVRKRKARAIKLTCVIMGSPVPRTVPIGQVAIRLRAHHGLPPPGTRVLCQPEYEEAVELARAVGSMDYVASTCRWEVNTIHAIEGDRVVVRTSWGPKTLPADAVACFLDLEAKGPRDRVHGIVRRAGGPGAAIATATVRQAGADVVAPQVARDAFTIEREDGVQIAVDLAGPMPRLEPQRRERGRWDELRADPLASLFPRFAPGPQEEFELAGAAVCDGEPVEAVGKLVARPEAPGQQALQPWLIATGSGAAGVVERALAERGDAETVERDSGPLSGRWSRGGHWFALAFAIFGGMIAATGAFVPAALYVSVCLATAKYHHRCARGLPRFHRQETSQRPPFSTAGPIERGLPGLIWPNLVGFCVAGAVLGLAVLGAWLIALAGAMAWSIVLSSLLASRDGPQARALAILARAPDHQPGAWGLSIGQLGSESFTRTIDFYTWYDSYSVTETVTTQSGGTAQVQSQRTTTHRAGVRREDVPDAFDLVTAQGPIKITGGGSATWGTSEPRLEHLTPRPGIGAARAPDARIHERIAARDPVAVYGQLQVGPDGGRSITFGGPGSLLVFGVKPGADPRAGMAALRRGHTLAVLAILAPLIPAIAVTLLLSPLSFQPRTTSAATSRAPAAPPSPPPSPEPEAPSPRARLLATPDLASAFAQTRPAMNVELDQVSSGTKELIRWASQRLRWSQIAVDDNETSFALARKDFEAALGKRMCVRGTIASITRQKFEEPLFVGVLDAGAREILQFIAVRSTGTLVEQNEARFCGVIVGAITFESSRDGHGTGVSLLGMFDLPENRTPPPVEAKDGD